MLQIKSGRGVKLAFTRAHLGCIISSLARLYMEMNRLLKLF